MTVLYALAMLPLILLLGGLIGFAVYDMYRTMPEMLWIFTGVLLVIGGFLWGFLNLTGP